jgi:hypothetical protein
MATREQCARAAVFAATLADRGSASGGKCEEVLARAAAGAHFYCAGRYGFRGTEELPGVFGSNAQQARTDANGWERAGADRAMDGIDADLEVRRQFVRGDERLGMSVQIANARHADCRWCNRNACAGGRSAV